MKGKQQLFSSKNQKWTTPKHVYDACNEVFNFTLDPCTNEKNPLGTRRHYTEKDDGLSKDWDHEIAFINPPYDNQRPFVEKAYMEDCTAVLLIPARPDTKLWQEIILPYSELICFVKGRLKFGDSKDAAPFPSALVVKGLNHSPVYRVQVREAFDELGFCIEGKIWR